jgi:hypothetical protein
MVGLGPRIAAFSRPYALIIDQPEGTSLEKIVETNPILFLYALISGSINGTWSPALTSLLIELEDTLQSSCATQILLDLVFSIKIHGSGRSASHDGSRCCTMPWWLETLILYSAARLDHLMRL